MTKTSTVFKVCYIAGLFTSLCAVMAQGAVTLLVLPSLNSQELTISFLKREDPIEVPWSADETLAPLNSGIIELGRLGASWAYLEQIVGASVADTMPQEYLVPLRLRTNSTTGSQYPTDVAHIQCECSWVAPTLPPATNTTFIQASLESFSIEGIQTLPRGIASWSFAYFSSVASIHISHSFLATLQYVIFQFHPSHFWALCLDSVVIISVIVEMNTLIWFPFRGGGPGDPVNLASVPSTNLSTA